MASGGGSSGAGSSKFALMAVAGVLAALGGSLWSRNTAPSPAADAAPKAPARAAARKPARPKVEPLPPSPTEADCAFDALCHVAAYLVPSLSAPPSQERVEGALGRVPKGRWLRTLVATVPDPLTSGFSREFDFAMDAIRRAFEGSGYVLARYWLPWEADDDRDAPAAGTPARELHLQQPGVLLFRLLERGAADREAVVAVLLVGESPVHGPHTGALRAALETVGRAAAWGQGEPDPLAPVQISILGPYFSGSARTLRRIADDWRGSDRNRGRVFTFHVTSGSATNLANLDAFAGNDWLFEATVQPDNLLEAGMWHFLVQSGASLDRTAKLTETSTPFGQQQNRSLADSVVDERVPAAEPAPPTRDRARFSIPFPLHIAEIRRDPGRPSSSEGGAQAVADPYRSAERGVDTPALFSESSRTAIGLELVETLGVLKQRELLDVAITASSFDDKAFLAKQVRGLVPDARVLLFESDLDLAAPEIAADLDGSLVASSYPLFAEAQRWTTRPGGSARAAPDGQRRRITNFPCDAAEGIFNATTALLGGAELVDYRTPFASAPEVGPSIWISMVAAGRMWPVAVYRPSSLVSAGSDARALRYAFDRPPSAAGARADAGGDTFHYVLRRLPKTSFTIRLVLFLMMAVSLANALAFVPARALEALSRVPGLVAYRRASVEAARSRHHADLQRHQMLLEVGALALLLTMLTGLCALALVRAGCVYRADGLDAAIQAVDRFDRALVGLAAAAAMALVVAVASRPASLAGRLAAAAAALGAAALCVGACWTICCADGERGLLLFVRLARPSAGLTPALPLGLLLWAMYLACLFGLQRVRLRAWTDLSHVCDVAAPSIHALRRADQALSVAPWKGGKPMIVVLAAYQIIASFAVCHLSTIDGRGFDVAMVVAFHLVLFGALWAALRARERWRTTRQMLGELALHPIAPAFATLPHAITRFFSYPLFSVVPERVLIGTERAFLRALVHAAGAPGCEALRAKEAARLEVIAKVNTDRRPHKAGLVSVTRALSEMLSERWQQRADLVDGGKRAAPAAGPAGDVDRWHALAETFVALGVARLLGKVCRLLRAELSIASIGSVAAVVALTSYPFQPHGNLALGIAFVATTIAAVAFWLLIEMDRDEILSLIAKSTPGQVNWDWPFATRMISFVGLPLLGLFASQPWSSAATSWLGQALRVVLKTAE